MKLIFLSSKRCHGGAKVAILAVIAVAAVAAIAGGMMYQGKSGEKLVSASAAAVQGSSFNDAPAAATGKSSGSMATPAPVTVAPSASSTPAELVLKPATASDLPADISKIPSATPVPRVEVASVAGDSPAPATAPAANIDPTSYKDISFQVLAGYKYIEPVPREGAKPEEIEAERKKNQIPADVIALNGSKAVVEGWMVPMQVDDNGGVKSFVLVKTQPQCCFGDTQKMNEWIDVSMPAGQTAEFNVDRPVKVHGQLEVGEKVEDGFVLSIYRMKADKVSG
jgi:hypothetical protein